MILLLLPGYTVLQAWPNVRERNTVFYHIQYIMCAVFTPPKSLRPPPPARASSATLPPKIGEGHDPRSNLHSTSSSSRHSTWRSKAAAARTCSTGKTPYGGSSNSNSNPAWGNALAYAPKPARGSAAAIG